MRTLAIGDVHGASSALDALLAAVRPGPGDRVVFLGDYVDRGPDTRGVLDRLLGLRQAHPHAVFLRGNHELMMARARRDQSYRRMWLSVGGAQALASYGPAPGRAGTLADVPPEHWDLLDTGLRDSFETGARVFVHAGLLPGVPLAAQPEDALFWEFLDPARPPPPVPGKLVVCGHTSQRSGVPLDLGGTVCIDTNAYAGGWLTCLDADSLHYWQADTLGRVREADLPPR